MPTPLYWDILDAVRDVVAALPAAEDVRVTVRKEPSFVPLQDALRQCVIAPRKDLSESVRELTFENKALIAYDVFVVLVAPERWEDAYLQARMKFRDEVRLALWKPDAIAAVTEVFDVDYEPAPAVAGLEQPMPHQLDVTAQLFTFVARVARSS